MITYCPIRDDEILVIFQKNNLALSMIPWAIDYFEQVLLKITELKYLCMWTN